MNRTENLTTQPGETERVLCDQDLDAAKDQLSEAELDAVAGGAMEGFHAYAAHVARRMCLDQMLPSGGACG
jgi:hypothetical protein